MREGSRIIVAALALMIISKSALSHSCEGGIRIDRIVSDGAILVLTNGSAWYVDPLDSVTSSHWLPASDILVCEDEIINVGRGERVSAQRIPQAGGQSFRPQG